MEHYPEATYDFLTEEWDREDRVLFGAGDDR